LESRNTNNNNNNNNNSNVSNLNEHAIKVTKAVDFTKLFHNPIADLVKAEELEEPKTKTYVHVSLFSIHSCLFIFEFMFCSCTFMFVWFL